MTKPPFRQHGPGPGLVRLAIPNKGRIAQPINELIERSGLHLVDGGERRLITRTHDPNVEILFARPIDIPEYVASGVADLGITGRDMVLERGSAVEQVLDLQIGKATLVVAVPEEADIKAVADLDGAKVATEFPSITRSFFAERGITVTVVTVSGACEATPHLGIADAIVDLSSSGTTLRTNHLRVIEEVLTSTTVLVANPDALAAKREKIDELVLALESVIRAKGQCYLMMNVHRNALSDVKQVLPGLSGPTVMDVASDENLVAVHAVVTEDRVYQLINQLKRAGAKDILVMPIERIIR
ncbi:ATP phosphoribosyltransferase [Methanoculleus sp. 7T]|jgi:ATP phosphoribosyltransferase|uniref:ATP phosphoribosyltransferase n=1 Tax=Methanoculleus sp. 7T TaxID=2937282 RepID=UPI0020BFF426|nr:ATP phosphoribosyltransferase [Methanoculleus sp. 7T]MCK8517747.1 ATP phosphoribosyltransferase [Methanoculleus sp. 7T]